MDSVQNKEESPILRFFKISGSILSCILLIFNIYKLLYSEWDWLSKALLVSAIILLWGFALYVVWKKTTIGEKFQTPTQVPAYSKRKRQVALTVAVLIPVLFLVWIYKESLPSDKVIVAVAEFQGPDPQSYRVTELLLAHLRQVTKEYPQILILPLSRAISEQDGPSVVQTEGHKVKATMIIWGWYGKTEEKVLLTSNLEFLRPLKHSFPVDRDICTSPASDLNRFRVQEDLSTRLAYLVLTTVGLLKLDAKDYQEAVILFTNALAQNSVSEGVKYSAYFFRAFAHQQGGDSDRAITDYTASIKLKGDVAETYNNRGNSYARKGEYDSSINDYGDALRLKPAYAEAYNNRGAAFLRKKLYRNAISDLDKAVELNPNYLEAYLNRGYAYSMEKQHDLAFADYTRTIQLAPEDARGYSNRGASYLEKGDAHRGLDDLNRAIQLDPNYAQAYNNRGIFYGKGGDNARAIKDFHRAISLDGNYAAAYDNRGNTYKNMGDWIRALADYNQAILVGPRSASAYYNRGNLRREHGELDLAIADYSRAIEIEPAYLSAYLNRGVARMDTGDLDGSIADYREALGLDPTNSTVYCNLCRVKTLKNDFAGALADCQQAIKLNPDNVIAYDNRGFMKALTQDTVGAVEDFEKVLKLNPNFPNSLHNLAAFRHAEKMDSDAEQLYKRLIVVLEHDKQIALPQRILYLEDYVKFMRDIGKREEAEKIEEQIRSLTIQKRSTPSAPTAG